MGRLIHCVLFSVGAILFVSADDGWRRISEPVVKHDGRARSSDSGSRIPFNPEDRVVPPPPWLIPPNPKHLGFPPERPKVMSFFDEDPAEFLPWPLRNQQNQQNPQSRASQSFQDLPSFLQPPPQKKEVAVAQPVQHSQSRQDQREEYRQDHRPDHRQDHRQDQRKVPVYNPKSKLAPPPVAIAAPLATVPPSVANLKQLPSALANEQHETSFNAPESAAKPTVAPQNTHPEASRRKSVRPVYDSSEYDYEEASHDQINSRTEDETFIDDEDAYYDNQQRRQSNKNSQSAAEVVQDYEEFDPEETIFRTQVSSQFRPQQQQPSRYYDVEEEAQLREEEPEERPAAARPSSKGQASRKQQQVQQSGRDRSPTEASRFETERPHSKPEQRQQPDDDWQYRAPTPPSPPPPTRKSKPKTPPPVTEPPEEHLESVNFESGKTKVKSPSFFAPPETEKPRRTFQQKNTEKPIANKSKQPEYDFNQSEAPLDTRVRTRRPKPTQSPYEPASFAPEEQEYPEFQPPRARRPAARPTPKPKPETVEPEFFEDDEPLIPFSVPSPKTRRPQQNQQQHHQQEYQEPQNQDQFHVPKDGTLATKGLQTLKTLAALQAERQPPQRPQQREPVEEKVKSEPRRPAKRPSANRYQPPNPEPAYETEPKSSGGRYPESEPIPFGFFNAQEPVDDIQQTGEERSDEAPPSPPPKPFANKQTTTTTTTEPPISAESEEKKPSTLFPPFNKRARPTPSTAAPEKVEVRKPVEKEPAPVVPRITSYKQRIEAMKERVKQQQQHAQPKKDDEEPERVEAVTTTTTSTTTTRRPTTRAKFPTRMPTKKPMTVASTTTESAALEKELPSFDESRRRFRPKGSYNRRPEIKDEAEARSDEVEESPKKEAKLRDNPYRRNQQKEKSQPQEEAPVEPRPSKDPSKRRPNFSRTTSRPVIVQEEEPEEMLPAKKAQQPEPEEEPTIELVEVASVEADKKPVDEPVEEPKIEEHYEPTQEPFVEKPARIEEMEPVEESEPPRERMPIFTMVTNDPMLPIEELLNIRIRDDGKGM